MSAPAAMATIGHNQPPEPTPFEALQIHVADLMETAQGFLDGEPITTQAVADEVGRLLDAARQAEKATEAQRKIEAKPFDDGKAEVQARYKPLAATCELVASTAKKALAPFLAAEQARKDAEAESARRIADEAAARAREALQASGSDLLAREAAEALLKDAKKAEGAASRAGKDKAMVAGGLRSVSLRTNWNTTVSDFTAFARWAWEHRRAEYEAFLRDLAQREGRRGPVPIPGIETTPERSAV